MRAASLYRGAVAAGLTAFLALLTSCEGERKWASKSPARLVSCDPELSRVLVAFGASARVVGADSASRELGELARAVDLGPGCTHAADLAGVLRADALLLLGTEPGRVLAAGLEARGLAPLVLEPRGLDGVLEAYEQLGSLLDCPPCATLAGGQLTREIAHVATRRDGKRRLRVAWLIGRRPLVAVGGEGMLHEMLELAGAENAFHEGTERKHVTQAAVVAAAPDLVLDATGATPSDPLGLPDALEIRRVPPGWSELPALDPLTRIRGLHALLYPEDATP